MLRVATGMQDADNHYHTLFEPIEHGKREAAQEGAAGRSMNQLMSKRRLGKSNEYSESFVEKILTQSAPLLLVPRCRFVHVLFRLGADADLEC
jgi:hypothetical protein